MVVPHDPHDELAETWRDNRFLLEGSYQSSPTETRERRLGTKARFNEIPSLIRAQAMPIHAGRQAVGLLRALRIRERQPVCLGPDVICQ